MKHRFTTVFIAALLALTFFAAAWHLTTRTETGKGAIAVLFDGRRIVLAADALPHSAVKGEIVDGKGDVTVIDAQGIALADLLAAAGAEDASAVTVVATDEYSARLTSSEFDRAHIILLDDGALQLIVFDDPDSRRNVRNLAEVIAE